jgi:putative ubiquitin-RnfH superfamily antitoxin RatB of RatAB toxin-antitoxin module
MPRCEVAYARPDRQFVIEVELPEGATARDALMASRLLETCTEIDPSSVVLGVYGRVIPAEFAVREGDRVEVYRPLKADPRVARRARVISQRARR